MKGWSTKELKHVKPLTLKIQETTSKIVSITEHVLLWACRATSIKHDNANLKKF